MVEGRLLSHGGRKYYCARFNIHLDKELLLPVGDVFYDGKVRNTTILEVSL
jgi:hypothetical protein